jgi:hypothetical protein
MPAELVAHVRDNIATPDEIKTWLNSLMEAADQGDGRALATLREVYAVLPSAIPNVNQLQARVERMILDRIIPPDSPQLATREIIEQQVG